MLDPGLADVEVANGPNGKAHCLTRLLAHQESKGDLIASTYLEVAVSVP